MKLIAYFLSPILFIFQSDESHPILYFITYSLIFLPIPYTIK
ncbi:hypothetical protein HMPREF1987_00456 [Peptostreptococcaceae bacterium oral taxon 113 str. W5053]|nr:hypothetical protein HMPREF1987_00456 [Peptostreptococcaceae bacterium oral taxon 113 str. W5053]